MSTISTHILDTSRGRPAAGVHVTLEIRDGESFRILGEGDTNADGRIAAFVDSVEPGVYRLSFATSAYFAAHRQTAFYPRVDIHFEIGAADEHYHVPLLLNPFGYSTYRGS